MYLLFYEYSIHKELLLNVLQIPMKSQQSLKANLNTGEVTFTQDSVCPVNHRVWPSCVRGTGLPKACATTVAFPSMLYKLLPGQGDGLWCTSHTSARPAATTTRVAAAAAAWGGLVEGSSLSLGHSLAASTQSTLAFPSSHTEKNFTTKIMSSVISFSCIQVITT